MKQKFISLYIDLSQRIAQLSHARRLRVGAVVVKDHRILSYGYNGTPAGFDNNCEIEIDDKLVTNPVVIHAEMNAIAKVAKHGDSCIDANIFITHSPCIECAKLICQSGINKVYYAEDYRSDDGIQLLRKGNIEVIKVEKDTVP